MADYRRPSVAFEMPDLALPGEPLSAREIDFFVANGFLVKRGMLRREDLGPAMKRVWAYLADNVPMADGFDPPTQADPASWRDPGWAKMPAADTVGFYEGRQRNVHARDTVKLHDLGSADFVVDLVPNNPKVREVAKLLLGDDLRPSTRTRGVYALFPTTVPPGADGQARRRATALGPHTDRVCQQLNVCAYLDDVPPRNGGFTLYPGSHKTMFRAHRCAANWSPLPSFRDAVRSVVRDIVPLELPGAAGDVIFWHGRTVHSAGIHTGERIRWAVFGDFTLDAPTLTPDEHRELGQYEWFKDTELLRDDAPATGDMWRDWRLGRTR